MSEANVPSNHPNRAKNGRPSAKHQSKPQPAQPHDPLSNPFVYDALDQSDLLGSAPSERQEGALNEGSPAGLPADAAAMAINPPPRDKADHPTGCSNADSHRLHEELGTVAETWLQSSSTDLSDLISLIQELNQCNSLLLDRVSQLEQALERSQNALKAEVKRSQNYSTDYSTNVATEYNAAEWGNEAAPDFTLTQEQAIDLYQQLESVHQTSQRQQILVETLTGQLESSQERVAQLEREAALVQQRYNEQSQRLIQSENNCRDLHARLHRQQRYTLQFKAALEKSLDVATPAYESVTEAVAVTHADGSFVPKVQHIRPWASPDEISPARFPWMNLSGNLDTESSDADSETGKAFDPSNLPIARSRRSRLAAVKLPGFQPIDAPSFAPSGKEASGKEIEVNQTEHQNSAEASREPVRESMVPNEQLLQKLDSVVQPLADLIADAMLSEKQDAGQSEIHQESHWDVVPESYLPSSSVAPVDAAAHLSATEAESSSRSGDDLLNSVMADAEDALWQDLARLIDVSTEDVVKASLSGDLSAFESIDFQALHKAEANAASEPELSSWFGPDSQVEPPQQSPTSDWFEAEPRPSTVDAPAQDANTPPAAASAFDNPGWPSPVVYPSRSTKKRRSLAAVDLPSFLPQAPGPLPT